MRGEMDENPVGSQRLARPYQEDFATYVNINFQAINNLIKLGGSYKTNDLDVYLDISDYFEHNALPKHGKKGKKHERGSSKSKKLESAALACSWSQVWALHVPLVGGVLLLPGLRRVGISDWGKSVEVLVEVNNKRSQESSFVFAPRHGMGKGFFTYKASNFFEAMEKKSSEEVARLKKELRVY
ncbi:hypothetical protein Pfo_025714 [Paulownia fortunei]|nr:hypothetical protein Pfo_025714 [Paulownia fortunei]